MDARARHTQRDGAGGDRPTTPAHRPFVAIAVFGLLFFVFGFVTWLNGSLIPFLRIVCRLSAAQALFVTFAFYIAYTVMALPMGAVLRRTGYRTGMALGLVTMSGGALLHIPAAGLASFPLFLVALFVTGTGLTILQTASNPYIVLLGPAESAATRISIMGIINKGAGVLAPLVFTTLVVAGLGDVATLSHQALTPGQVAALAAGLVRPYVAMAVVLAALAAMMRLVPLPDIAPQQAPSPVARTSILHFPHLVLGALTLFGYMGLEVMAGDTIGLFGQNLGVAHFMTLTSFTLGFMVLGYCVAILAIPRVVSQRGALAAAGYVGLLCTLGIVAADPHSAAISRAAWGWTGLRTVPDPIFFVALMGMANALVWPTVWPLALRGLGTFTASGSALLIMAISGGAIIPQLFGLLTELAGGMQRAYVLGVPCWALILFYAHRGHRLERW